MQAEVDAFKLVNPPIPTLGHPSHLALVHLRENGNDDCDVGREDDRLRWVSPGKEGASSDAQDGQIHWFCILCLLVQSSIVLARAQKTHLAKV